MSVHPPSVLSYNHGANSHCLQVLSWFWPFAATPDRNTGLEFEVNGFEGAFDSIHLGRITPLRFHISFFPLESLTSTCRPWIIMATARSRPHSATGEAHRRRQPFHS